MRPDGRALFNFRGSDELARGAPVVGADKDLAPTTETAAAFDGAVRRPVRTLISCALSQRTDDVGFALTSDQLQLHHIQHAPQRRFLRRSRSSRGSATTRERGSRSAASPL